MNFADFLNADLSDDTSEEEEIEEKIPLTKNLFHKLAEQGDTEKLKKAIYQYEHRDYNPKDPELSVNMKDGNGATPLHLALFGKHLDTAKFLIEKGSKVEESVEGNSCYHVIFLTSLQCESNNYLENGFKLISSYNLSINSVNYLKQTILHLCGIYDHIDCLKFITNEYKAFLDLKLVDYNENNIIHICSIYNSINVLKYVLELLNEDERKVLINNYNQEGYNSMHYCCLYNNINILKLLIANGGNIEIKDKKNNKSCIDISKECSNNIEIIKILEKNNDVKEDNDKLCLKKKMLIITNNRSLNHITYDENDEKSVIPNERLERVRSLIDPTYNSILMINKKYNNHNDIYVSDRRGNISDVLRVHDYFYINKIKDSCKITAKDDNDDSKKKICSSLDGDTTVSIGSFESAMYAIGTICDAIDKVIKNEYKNAFCIIRPPGHHVGVNGSVKNVNNYFPSVGFCLFNNVAIAASYIRVYYHNLGINNIAILDFDVHHGNGTEDIIRNLQPRCIKDEINLPYCSMKSERTIYKPWLNEKDGKHVFFGSVHGYGNMSKNSTTPSYFYPGSGDLTDIKSEDKIEYDEIGCPIPLSANIVNVPLKENNGKIKSESWRNAWLDEIFPKLIEFKPDIILLSAGFDAHYKDVLNCGYCSITEYDYEWFTDCILSISHNYCNDRVISILEGGYNVNGRGLSPFASSVSSHVRSLKRDYSRNYNKEEFRRIEKKEEIESKPYINLRKRKLDDCCDDRKEKKIDV